MLDGDLLEAALRQQPTPLEKRAADLEVKLRNAVETLKWYAEWDWSKDEYNEGISTRATFCLKELEGE